LEVGIKGPGIFFEILAGAELGGIDEDGDDDEVAFSDSDFNQRDMADMKSAHCRHEADFLALCSGGFNEAPD
jgi:hypothetical protein